MTDKEIEELERLCEGPAVVQEGMMVDCDRREGYTYNGPTAFMDLADLRRLLAEVRRLRQVIRDLPHSQFCGDCKDLTDLARAALGGDDA